MPADCLGTTPDKSLACTPAAWEVELAHVLKFSDPVHAVAQHGDLSLVATVGRRLVRFELLKQQDPQQTWSPQGMAGENEAKDEGLSSSCSMLPSAMKVLKVNPSGGQYLFWCAAPCTDCTQPGVGTSCSMLPLP